MTKLSVNVNKIATIRNARGKDTPNVLQCALDIVKFGAHGITVHPRPDGRHIRHQDVHDLKKHLQVELNVEGYPDQSYMQLIQETAPAQATLVPDPPHVITSNAGWEISKARNQLGPVVEALKKTGTRVSVFVDVEKTTKAEYEWLKSIGVDRVELFTEKYAEAYFHAHQQSNVDKSTLAELDKVTQSYSNAAKLASDAGLGLNAGHDLSLQNLRFFVQSVRPVLEVSIGHALISDALYMGLEKTVQAYLAQLK